MPPTLSLYGIWNKKPQIRGPQDHMKIFWFLGQTRRMPESMVSRILVSMWTLGLLHIVASGSPKEPEEARAPAEVGPDDLAYDTLRL